MLKIILLFIGFAISNSCFADLSDELKTCYAIKLQKSKLACYDKVSSAVLSSSTAKQPTKKSWSKEPDSFMGVKFGAPIKDSVDDCPSKTKNTGRSVFAVVDWDVFESTSKQVCFDNTDKDSKYHAYKIKPSLAKGFEAKIKIETDPSGNVWAIIATTYAESWKYLSELLVSRYGPPTAKEIGSMTLRNGAKLSTEHLTWLGEKTNIVAYSHDKREIMSGHIFDMGSINVITDDFSNSINKKQEERVGEAAGKL